MGVTIRRVSPSSGKEAAVLMVSSTGGGGTAAAVGVESAEQLVEKSAAAKSVEKRRRACMSNPSMVGAFAPVRVRGLGIFGAKVYSLQFCPMNFRRLACVLGTIGLSLMAYSAPASAHGVEVTADIDGSTATLELTDETGEVCVAVDPAPPAAAVVAIVDDESDEVLLILGEGFNATSACQFFDVDIVNGILADVDAHRLVIASGRSESSGLLTKPRVSESETAIAPSDDDTAETIGESETNVPLVFGVGIAIGIAAVVIRKRFFS